MKRNEKVTLENLASRTIHKMMEKEANAWPPVCEFITYQPRRPYVIYTQVHQNRNMQK